jgi:hypothetical protein
VEYKEKKNAGQLWPGEDPTGWEINGVTDSQGKASGSFMGVLKTNYNDYIFFDYTSMQLPAGFTDYSIINAPSSVYLSRTTHR